MKQSSIDWLIEQMESELAKVDKRRVDNPVFYGMQRLYNYVKQSFPTAREMHRQEIEEAYRRGMFSEGFENEKQYYTETFKQHG